jgi:hypothetical protein
MERVIASASSANLGLRSLKSVGLQQIPESANRNSKEGGDLIDGEKPRPAAKVCG